VKRALLLALVIIVLVMGLPLLMGMGTMSCDYCGSGVLLPLMCLAALAGAAVLLPVLLRARLRLSEHTLRLALFASLFERPPQLV
jgi:hypothetical protein